MAEAINRNGRKFNVSPEYADALVADLQAAQWTVEVLTPNPDPKAPNGSVHLVLSKAAK